MNMLWLAGDAPDHAAELTTRRIWTGRANDIETFDSVAFTGEIGGTQALYCASHAIPMADQVNPMFRYEFEKGVCVFSEDEGGELSVQLYSGETVRYGRSVPNGSNVEKLWQVLSACASGNWATLPCPGEAALSHAKAMDCINSFAAQNLSDRRIRDPQREAWIVPGLGDWLKAIYFSGALPESF